jgi:hypothetical protein
LLLLIVAFVLVEERRAIVDRKGGEKHEEI